MLGIGSRIGRYSTPSRASRAIDAGTTATPSPAHTKAIIVCNCVASSAIRTESPARLNTAIMISYRPGLNGRGNESSTSP
jgi:hypothetical protein